MARFYGNVQGSRGEATRLGTKSSGIQVHPRGWNAGVRVRAYFDEELGKDVFNVYRTSGSNGHSPDVLIGMFVEGEDFVTINPSCNPRKGAREYA